MSSAVDYAHRFSWTPEPLGSCRPLPWAALRQEIHRLTVEKADGQLELVLEALDSARVSLGSKEIFDGAALAELRLRFIEGYFASREAQLQRRGSADLEVIPLRSQAEHHRRRSARTATLLALGLRRLEWLSAISDELRFKFLASMQQVRATDDELKTLYYPGVPTPIPGRNFGGKGFRSTWQEAIVGVGHALEQRVDEDGAYCGDVAAPMIRDLGVGLAMGYPAEKVIAAQLGKASSPMNGGFSGRGGRDLHWGDLEGGLLVATAPLAIAASTMTGLALGFQRRGEARVGVSFIGEGGSSQGDWYEAVNFAAVRRLPLLIFVENNRVALGTPVARQSAVDLFADKAAAIGVSSFTVDGSDPEALYAATRAGRELALSGAGPVLIAVEAMRGCGHAHHDDERYRKVDGERVTGYADHEAYDVWAEREPLRSYPKRLAQRGLMSIAEAEAGLEAARAQAKQIREAVGASPWASTEGLGEGVQPGENAASHPDILQARASSWSWTPSTGTTPDAQPLDEAGWTYRVAIEEALCEAARRHGEEFVMLGEDLEYGGAFGVTQRMRTKGYGGALVDTPLAESCIVGAAVGLALQGFRPLAEIQFNAFAAHAFSQIVNSAATIHWRYGHRTPMVIRIPVGAGLAGGPYHALSNEGWFLGTPGLRVLYPSTPHDAYHGLLQAIADDAPVLFLEHLTLYPPAGRTTAFGFPVRQSVDIEAQDRVIGRADCKRRGDDLTIISYGAMVHFALLAAERVAEERGASVEVIDLRSLWPLDVEACLRSVQKTGRFLVLQEAAHRSGFGHYVVSRILEQAFMDLDAPPVVLGGMDILPPFAPHLEAAYLPSVETIAATAGQLLDEARRNSGA